MPATKTKKATKMKKATKAEVVVLQTNNEGHGFWGTVGRALGEKDTIYAGEDMDCEVSAKVARETLWSRYCVVLQRDHGLTPEQAVEFLDSTPGRHFADLVTDHCMIMEMDESECEEGQDPPRMYRLDLAVGSMAANFRGSIADCKAGWPRR